MTDLADTLERIAAALAALAALLEADENPSDMKCKNPRFTGDEN